MVIIANPQKENGYTPIANEILDAVLKTNFTATQQKIILTCWRYTYGFSRKDAKLSESFISKITGISKRYIAKELQSLIAAKIIDVVAKSTYTTARIMAFNKDYEKWECRTTVQQANYSSTGEQKQDTTVEPQFDTTVELQFHQDKQTLKQNIKKGVHQEIFDYYLTLNLMKHKTLNAAMKAAIDKAIKDNKYTVEDCKTLLDRHNKVVAITKNDGQYRVRPRGLNEFFGQKVKDAQHLICSEYEEGGKYYEKYKAQIVQTPKRVIEIVYEKRPYRSDDSGVR